MSRLGQVLFFLGIVFLVAWFIALRALSEGIMPFVWVLLGVGAACILGAVFKDIKFFIELAGQRSTKHGLNLGVLVIIVTAVLVGVNFIGYRHIKKLDYTKEGIRGISDQTKNILKSLDSDLEVHAFFAENLPNAAGQKEQFNSLVGWYKAQTPKLKVSVVDPVKRPDEAKAYDVNASGTVALKYKGRSAKFEDISEEKFTNAIIKLTRDKNKVVYLVTGHGERDSTSSDANGAQQLKKYLSDSSYDVKTFSFVEKQKIPDDAAVVAIVGPTQAYFDAEINAIKDYLYGGGKLFLALDPGTKTNLSKLTEALGVEFKNNYILDPIGQFAGGSAVMALGVQYSSMNEITKGLKGVTIFLMASSLKQAKDKPAGYSVEEIVKSSPESFTKPELKKGNLKLEKTDEKGPLTIVAAVSGKMKEEQGKPAPQDFQAVIAGDSDFLSNQMIDAQPGLNHDLALNAVSFLAKDKELVSIRPKPVDSTPITVTAIQLTVIKYGVLAVLPLLIFVTGGAFWYRRRMA